VKDTDAVRALLWTAKDEIPLSPNFIDDSYRAWVREECRRRNVWIVEREGTLAGTMIMQIEIMKGAAQKKIAARTRGLGAMMVLL
jgi:hypothetical protein